MTERLSTTTTEAPRVDPETVAEIDGIDAERITTEHLDYWQEARDRIGNLLDEHDLREKQSAQEAAFATYDEPFVPEAEATPSSETDETHPLPEVDDTAELNPDEDDPETPEKKERLRRTRGVLKAIGRWSVTSLEANGFIPIRGTWHKRNGGTAFIAKAYVWNKKRKAERLAGFLSPEASAQLNGETSPEDSPDDDNEDENRLTAMRRQVGRAALTAMRKTGRAPKTAYKTWKAIKNVAK